MKGRACGKLILCGEHAVVHGHPAIAVPVDLYTEITLVPQDGPLTIDHELESPRHEDRLDEALAIAFPDGGMHVSISTNIPVGVGMGSSAALSVALARALGLEEPELREKAMALERSFHGDPSGLDVAVSLRGEPIWFIKGKPMQIVARPKSPIVVIDSGTAGDTKQLVAEVAEQLLNTTNAAEVLSDIGALVHAARAVLEDSESLGDLLTENHALLRQLRVSTPTLDQIVDLAIASGAYGAKLSGAGGGGVCIALIEEPEALLRTASAAGFDAWIVHDPR